MRNVYAAIGRACPGEGWKTSKVIVERINGQVYAIVEEVRVFEADEEAGMQISGLNIPIDISG